VLVEVARADTDAGGEFVLRGELDPSLDYLRDPNGSLALMVVASTPASIAFGIDTVWFDDAPRASDAQWTTVDPEFTESSGEAALAAFDTAGTPEAASQRPYDLTLRRDPSASGATGDIAASSAVPPPVDDEYGIHCWLDDTDELPDVKTTIGTTRLRPNPYWEETFTYKTSATTSHTAGWSLGAKAVLKFDIAGSTTNESSISGNLSVTTKSDARRPIGKKHWITSSMWSFEWRCGWIPFPPLTTDWPVYYTVEVGEWERNFLADTMSPLSCNIRNTENTSGLQSGSSYEREDGSKVTLKNSFSVGIDVDAKKGRFKGDATVTNDFEDNDTVNVGYKWLNTSTHDMYLCGRTGKVRTGDTEVVAMGPNTFPPGMAPTTTTTRPPTTTTRPPLPSTTTTGGGGT